MGALEHALAFELRLFQDLVDEVTRRAADIIETAHARKLWMLLPSCT